MFCRRGIGQYCIADIAARQRIGVHHILAQPQRIGDDGRHRLNGGRIHFAQLLYPAEDIVKFRHHRLYLAFRDGNPSERGDLADGCRIDRHECAASRQAGRLQARTGGSL